jgi:hypothetical protein
LTKYSKENTKLSNGPTSACTDGFHIKGLTFPMTPSMSTSYGILKTEGTVQYLRKLLAVELGHGEDVQMPDWDLELLEEMHYNVKVVAQAIRNKSE